MKLGLGFFALISVVYLQGEASAASELGCTLAGRGLIQIDGLLDDWGSMPELTKAAADPRDAGLAVRCAYDEARLYVMVNVTDDRLIRTRQKGRAEDHLVLRFAGDALEVWPASAEQGAKLAYGWTGKGAPRPTVADSLQKHGWSVELALPLRGLPGYARGAPGVTVAFELHDADSFTDRGAEKEVDTGDVFLSFEEASANLKGFLDALHLRRGDVTFDKPGQIDGEPGLERVVAAGKYIGIIGDGYVYIELPVSSPRDVLSVELADLEGGGRQSLLVRTVERGNGGAREVLSIYHVRDGQIGRLFAHEIGKQLGRSRLTNVWQLVPRGKKKGLDLVIKPGEVAGFSAETWNETPATDMVPILLPWGDKKQEVWHFEAGGVSGG